MARHKKKFGNTKNPLVVLTKILANGLLDDKYGVNATAYNAFLLLASFVDPDLPEEIAKKSVERNGRFRYGTGPKG